MEYIIYLLCIFLHYNGIGEFFISVHIDSYPPLKSLHICQCLNKTFYLIGSLIKIIIFKQYKESGIGQLSLILL